MLELMSKMDRKRVQILLRLGTTRFERTLSFLFQIRVDLVIVKIKIVSPLSVQKQLFIRLKDKF